MFDYSLVITIFISFFLCYISYLFAIPALQEYSQPIRSCGPQPHLATKRNIPTFGGVIIIMFPIVILLLMTERLDFITRVIIATISIFATLGFWDDYVKIIRKSHHGISGKLRFTIEYLASFLICYFLYSYNIISTKIILYPFKYQFDLGIFYLFFAAFIITGSANAVNLTDGLDGLAIVPVMIVLALISFLATVNDLMSDVTLLFVLLIIGSCLAFLRFNYYPAQIFMGDVGSLPLGALLGILSIVYNLEIILMITGMLFVIETLSVILQVISYKLCRKRIFLMAPLHHHFEKLGMAETTIVLGAWLFTLFCSTLAILCFYIN